MGDCYYSVVREVVGVHFGAWACTCWNVLAYEVGALTVISVPGAYQTHVGTFCLQDEQDEVLLVETGKNFGGVIYFQDKTRVASRFAIWT